MSNYKQALDNLHKIFRLDPYIQNLLFSAGQKLDYLDKKADDTGKEFWFHTMSEVGIAILEKQMDYIATSSTLEGKREELEGRWKIGGKCDLYLLQKIADSWRNGEVAIMFTNAVIEITFISVVGIPRDLDALKRSLEEAKPAHLPIKYNFTYRTWGVVKQKNYEHYQKYTWEDVLKAEGV